MTNDELLQTIQNLRSLKRQHASFYDWPEKQIKESGIIDEFLDPNNHKGIHDYVSFSIPDNDPPDAIIYKNDDEEALLEITELVNQQAIESQINNDSTYLSESQKWLDRSYFEKQLNEIIQIKNQKCTALFNQTNNVQLLLHTDEVWLEAYYKKHFEAGVTIQPHSFTNIWLMLSYSSNTKSHQIIQV
jgi:hypothetical protein